MTLPLPITLATASTLALLAAVIATRAAMGRGKHGILMGDGGNPDMIARMRTHANFVEYVPLLLILMGLLEIAGANRTLLIASGVVLLLARVLHAIGMARPAPNVYRAAGTVSTFLLVLLFAGYGLVVAISP
jgi:uncharacterized membrane protein YecN with MAPEG domain